MNKLKKKVLGILGAIAVAVMTLVAYAIPTNAAEDITSITHEIIVSVYDKYPYVEIKNLSSGDIILEDIVNIEYDYINTNTIEFQLVNSEGVAIESWIDELGYFDPTTVPTGTLNHELDFTYAGYDEYTLYMKAYGGADTLTFEDSFVINHVPAKIIYVGTNENNEPIFEIEYRYDDVDSLHIDIYDENGRPLFDPELNFPDDTDSRYRKIGDEEQISENVKRVRIVIPMPESANTGNYTASIGAYDEDDEQIGYSIFYDFYFELPAPDVPDTGRFSGLKNIATSDFLISGLLIFFTTAIAGLIILTKKKHSDK